jgi:hypothetical protein
MRKWPVCEITSAPKRLFDEHEIVRPEDVMPGQFWATQGTVGQSAANAMTSESSISLDWTSSDDKSAVSVATSRR